MIASKAADGKMENVEMICKNYTKKRRGGKDGAGTGEHCSIRCAHFIFKNKKTPGN